MVKFIKRNSKPPDIAHAGVTKRLFGERFGAAIKAAGRRTEAKIGVIVLGEAIEPLWMGGEQPSQAWFAQGSLYSYPTIVIDLRARIDAPRGDMSPGRFGHGANSSDRLWKENVSLQGFSLSRFASVYIGKASVTGSVDKEPRFGAADVIKQNVEVGVIERLPCQWDKNLPAASQLRRKRLAYISSCSEEKDHALKPDLRGRRRGDSRSFPAPKKSSIASDLMFLFECNVHASPQLSDVRTS